jgi:predicted transcriptional regulator
MILYGKCLNTIHLNNEERWYETKKPRLQIEVLACLALRGELSKGEVESILQNRYHADILLAFKKLEEGNRIHVSRFSRSGKGRKKKYYRITNEGLKLLITDTPDPESFWIAMIGFCYHNHREVPLSEIDVLYNSFVNRYLKYPSAYGHSFHVDLFNEMSDQWRQNIILNRTGIGCAQKILEVLAVRPGITLERLVDETGDSVGEVQKALSLYLPIFHKPFEIGKEVKDARYIKRDWKFFLHNTVTEGTDIKNALVYELSLFGIMLVLTLIRHNDMDRLRHGMYYNNLTFQEYQNIIASKYKNKLPLVFGKWHLLIRTLKELSGYGFDIILDKESRLKRFGKPVSLGGNKEYYDAALAIIQHSRKQLDELQKKGLALYKTVITNQLSNIERKNYEKKTEAIFYKILEISTILNPQTYDPGSFKEAFKETLKDPMTDKDAIERMGQLYSLEVIERMFARDITSLYYLNFHNKHEFQFIGPAKYYSKKGEESMDRILTKGSKKIHKQQNGGSVSELPLLSSNDILLTILADDKEIRDWFSKWLEDLRNYQKETSEEMGDFHTKINPKDDQ